MKIRLLKCWLVLLSLALAFGWGQKNVANAQCIYFNGAATNVLTSFIDVYPNYPNSAATFDVLVQTTNQPLPVGTYLTWCVDQATELDPSQNYTVPGTIYTGALFATCDTNLNNELPTNHPASCYVSPAVWNEVNYILNHKNNAYFWDIQYAINDLVGGPFIDNTSAFPPFDINVVQSLVNAAVTNAATWSPQPGNVIGAIYVITNQAGVTLTNPVQLVMLEVPYCPITFTATPTNITLGCNPATIPTGNVANVTAVSSCGYPVNVTFTTSQATVGCTSFRYITYTAADGYGNSASYTQTIKWTVDTTAPILTTVPASTNLGYNPAVLPTDISISNQVSYTETCSAPVISVSHVDSGTPCAMLRTFSISATDACGNVSPTTKVVYQYAIDTNAPVVTTVPPSTNYGCTTVTLPTAATVLSQVTATDNCIVVSTNISSVDTTNGSTVTRTFTITATDGAGNVSTPKTVTYSYTINNGPTIQCAADITITGTNTSPSITGVPMLMDACGNSITCTNAATVVVTNFYNIYCDQFMGSSCSLNGRSPDSANTLGSKWCSSSSWSISGNEAVGSGGGNSFLPFTPQQGFLYEVSADVECLSGPGTTLTSDWVALGFANGSDTSDWWQTANNPAGWQLARNTGNKTYSGQSFVGPGIAGGFNNGFYPTNLTHYSIILDTRATNAAAWTFTFLVNGQVVTPTTACGGNGPNISTVGFGQYSYPNSGAVSHVKNFCVSYGVVTGMTNSFNLYCDQFSGSSSLNGRSPDLINLLGSKWCSSPSWVVNGNQAVLSNCTGNAFLPFQPQGGVVYQVSADIECLSGPGTTPTSDWIALGFCNGTVTSDWWQSANNPMGWQLIRNTGNTTYCGQSFMGPGVANGYNNGFFPTNLTHYCVVLDTRPSNPAAWTFTCLANGQVVTPTTACGGSGPNISSVGFGVFSYPCSGAVSHVKNFCISYGFSPAITNSATCSNLSYVDMVVPGSCAGQVHIVRTWYGWDNSGHTNSCTQNIYETIPLPPVKFASTTTSLGCSPSSLPTTSTVASLVIGYSGLSSTNITYVDSTNGCNVTRTFTVIVKDSCGDVSPAATLTYTWVNASPSISCCVTGPSSGTCLSAGTYNCTVVNNGNCAFSACTLTACGQTFTCPALQPGQSCVIPCTHTFQTCDLGTFNCQAVVSAVCATACAPTCSAQSSCPTKVCGQPSCKVTCSGPSSSCCFSPCTYTCTVVNNGNCPFSACTLSACGQNISCPALQPGQSCTIPVCHTFQVFECGWYTCQPVCNANCYNSTAPNCSAQTSCSTWVASSW